MQKNQDRSREDKLLSSPEALTNIVRRIAIDAGEIIHGYYIHLDTLKIDIKQDASPVTEADREAERFIKAALEKNCPTVPMIGEETVAMNTADTIKDKDDYFWLVDPLDGTKNFIEGGEEFTVNIALIKNRQPVLGVIYAPIKEELYAGCGEGTAIRWTAESGRDKAISVRQMPKHGLTVLASQSAGSQNRLEDFLDQFKIQKLVRKSSSLKICTIAAGKGDMYARFGPTCEWDTAAGDAILRSSGGLITDMKGMPLVYGGANEEWLNPEFVAASFEWYADEDA